MGKSVKKNLGHETKEFQVYLEGFVSGVVLFFLKVKLIFVLSQTIHYSECLPLGSYMEQRKSQVHTVIIIF